VDAGCGSGRFAVAIARRDPSIQIVAVDNDPVAALVCRAHLRASGARRFSVHCADYTQLELDSIPGRTAFIGNPPYVRHHDLSPATKAWALRAARGLGLNISGLAGLHALFFLATAHHTRPGDVGCFITSAEWLDVGYGAVLRELLTGSLGLESIHVLDAKAIPFADAMTTAVISCFRAGSAHDTVRVRVVDEPEGFGDLTGGSAIARGDLRRSARWSEIIAAGDHQLSLPSNDDRLVPLRSLARVHRGIVTGANRYFVLTREEATSRGLADYTRPVIRSASEVMEADGEVHPASDTRLLLDLPFSSVHAPMPDSVRAYLREGESAGIPSRYICSHRTPWWRIGPIQPPPIVATYMARRPPRFALNPDGLAILNVIHGIYPRSAMSATDLKTLVNELNANATTFVGKGRTYHGGLEKFEPREMEALLVPGRVHVVDALSAE
jgi:hypothetical protein